MTDNMQITNCSCGIYNKTNPLQVLCKVNGDSLICELSPSSIYSLFRSIFVTNLSPENYTHRLADTNLEATRSQALPLEIVRGLVSEKFSQRVLDRIAEAKDKEVYDPWRKDDLQIAWLTVLRADEGEADPWRLAFWQTLGEYPEKLIPFLVARADVDSDEHFPESLKPFRYTRDWPSVYLIGKKISERAAALPPKKPMHHVADSRQRKEGA